MTADSRVVRDEGMDELAAISGRATAAACFGEPSVMGDHVVIPAAEVTYGYGFGYGHDGGPGDDEARAGGGGGGGGSRVRAVAVIHASPDGVEVHPIRDETAMTIAGLAFAAAAVVIVARTIRKLVRG